MEEIQQLSAEQRMKDASDARLAAIGLGDAGAVKDRGRMQFLRNGIPSPKYVNPYTDSSYQALTHEDAIIDIRSLSASHLKAKYKLTYVSWQNVKQRCKSGYVLDQRFELFADFLRYMGPRQHATFTLDRIDTSNSTYSPECCRWADKHTQSQNRSNTVYLTHDGETLALAAWARKTGQLADTLYKRRAKGLSDSAVILGKSIPRNSAPHTASASDWPPGESTVLWAKNFREKCWENETKREFMVRVATHMLNELRDRYEDQCGTPDAPEPLPAAATTQIERWEGVRAFAYRRLHNSIQTKALRREDWD